MKIWDWLKGKPVPGDDAPYVPPPATERPATQTEIYLLCACIHFSASVILPILFYSVGGRGDETAVPGAEGMLASGAFRMPAEVGFVLWHGIQLLQWPMSWVLGFLSHMAGAPLFTGILGYIPLAVNSLLWAVPIYFAYHWLTRRRRP